MQQWEDRIDGYPEDNLENTLTKEKRKQMPELLLRPEVQPNKWSLGIRTPDPAGKADWQEIAILTTAQADRAVGLGVASYLFPPAKTPVELLEEIKALKKQLAAKDAEIALYRASSFPYFPINTYKLDLENSKFGPFYSNIQYTYGSDKYPCGQCDQTPPCTGTCHYNGSSMRLDGR